MIDCVDEGQIIIGVRIVRFFAYFSGLKKYAVAQVLSIAVKIFLVLAIYYISLHSSYALIEVDITRGNLNPLPIAVSPLSIDENSRNNFKKI